MKVSLAKALKLKNKQGAKIAQIMNKIQGNNSYKEGNNPTYNSRELLDNYMKEMSNMIALKLAINKANVGIYESILRLGELKSFTTGFKSLNVKEGLQSPSRYGADVPEVKFISTITEIERDKIVENTETEIEEIQDSIDHFNATTYIEV